MTDAAPEGPLIWLRRLLTRRRLGYAWVAGALLWSVWLASVSLGPGNLDLGGKAIGADYVQFYTAGYTLRIGDSERLYDLPFQARLQRQLVDSNLKAYYAFITPPFLAWLFVPLSALPYVLSFIVWSALSLGMLWLSMRLLGVERGRPAWRAFAWSLTWLPVFASVSYGQNPLLSLLIVSATYRFWRSGRGLASGLICSMALYKPQLVLGVGLLWLLEWRRDWPSLVGLLIGGLVLAGLSLALLPEASRAYVTFAGEVLPDLPNWLHFPLWNLHTVRGFFRLLLPGADPVADVVTLVVAIAAVVVFVITWRRGCEQAERRALLFAAAVALTLVLTPHAMIYDWVILLVPAVVLWRAQPQRRPELTSLFALIWVATFLSGALAQLQTRYLPVALQISVPVLLFVLYQCFIIKPVRNESLAQEPCADLT